MNDTPSASLPKTDAFATSALILGLLSLFCIAGPLTGIPAILCGAVALRRIANSNGTREGGGLALTGLILGCIGSLLIGATAYALYTKARGPLSKIGNVLHQVSESTWTIDVTSRVREYRRELGAWPTTQSIGAEEIDNASIVAAFQSQEKSARPIPAERIKDGCLVDRWGRALHIAVDLNNDGRVSIRAGDIEDISAIVWSDGPDGKNDFGEGDDVRSW